MTFGAQRWTSLLLIFFVFLFPNPIPSTTNEENLPVGQEEKVPREIQKKSVQTNLQLTLSPSLGYVNPSFPFEKSEFDSYEKYIFNMFVRTTRYKKVTDSRLYLIIVSFLSLCISVGTTVIAPYRQRQ